MKKLLNHIINKDVQCIEALKKLDQAKLNQTLFVLDQDQHLLGTVTDGDIRRGLINGLDIDSPVHLFCNQKFSYLNGKINVEEIRRLKKDGIKVLPKLNAEGQIEKVYDLFSLNSILPVHAVIMAGGRGERLRPLTDEIPKPMLPLGNKPIIEHTIDRLISYGVENITISVRYFSGQIIDHFGDGSDWGIKIDYIVETEAPLGTIGCLSLMDNIEQDTVLVINSDVFSNIDFEDFFLNYINSDAEMSVASIPYSVDIPYAIMELEGNIVKSFKEKPKNTYYANAGIYLMNKAIIELIPKDVFYNITDLMDDVIAKGRKLIHSPITGFWIDIGKPDDYNKAKEIIKHLSNV